ncbi:phosphoglycerate dehydrogenase [Petroclostridium sp. X23]|uniref:phosphoglycerate dehydrogenase n=1 Tax=Petroclostridium sp. X23 TaxID=3045146 RepID=UPI0024AD2B84|nr:phosphoglycerate dehydrogenase [Petroclostridium sp. X23]WHH58548.1 phosphoglycerate dehydrogenase [Petroclostridium sp. X23]
MNKILVTATNFSALCSEAKKMLLENNYEIIENTKGRPYTFDELKEVIGDIDGVIAGVDTWDEEVFKLAPKLKGIARFGVGVDNIDLAAAKKYGIKVTNCAGINSNSVSEHAVALILSMIRQIPRLDGTTRKGMWERTICHELNKMTVGFIGFGGIARLVAEKLNPFRCKMIAYDKYPAVEQAQRLNVEICDFEYVIKNSDIISIHVPCIPETVHMINDETIGMMKKGAFLVNTARGPVIDENALYNALLSNKLSMAAIDVYESEPVKIENPLLSLNNIICTPHAAAESYEVYHDTGIETATALLTIFDGKKPRNLLNK